MNEENKPQEEKTGEEKKKDLLNEVLKEFKLPPETPDLSRRKYFGKAAAVITGLSALVLLGVFLFTGKPEKPSKPEKPRRLSLPEKVEKEAWMAKEGARIGSLEKTLKDLQDQNQNLKERLEQLKKTETTPPPLPPLPPLPEETQKEKKKKPEPCPSCEEEVLRPSSRVLPPLPEAKPSGPALKSKAIKEWKPEKPLLKKLFLPPGSFVKGILLAGVDAPASLSLQQTPYPVLIRMTDYALLPNDFITDLRACVIVGSAYGDISSERVYIRSESLACLREDEELFSINIDLKANAVGEDGKLGLRGKVVSKEGQMIGKALVTGFISGISDILRSANRVTWYPFADWEDRVRSPSLQESFEAAGLGGVGKAADLLAKHYIDMMKRIYPVIEIEAGREVTLIVNPPGAVLTHENYYEIGK